MMAKIAALLKIQWRRISKSSSVTQSHRDQRTKYSHTNVKTVATLSMETPEIVINEVLDLPRLQTFSILSSKTSQILSAKSDWQKNHEQRTEQTVCVTLPASPSCALAPQLCCQEVMARLSEYMIVLLLESTLEMRNKSASLCSGGRNARILWVNNDTCVFSARSDYIQLYIRIDK